MELYTMNLQRWKLEVFAVDKQISLLPLSGPGLSACATLEYFYKSECSTQVNPFLKKFEVVAQVQCK